MFLFFFFLHNLYNLVELLGCVQEHHANAFPISLHAIFWKGFQCYDAKGGSNLETGT